MRKILDLLMRRESVLVAFVFSAIAASLMTDYGADKDNTILTILSLVTFPLLAWFTHKRLLLATWCTVLLLLISGSGLLYDGFTDLTQSASPAYGLFIGRILLGIYLTWGALIIHRERHLQD